MVLELSIGAKIASVASISTKLRWAVRKVSYLIVYRSLFVITRFCIPHLDFVAVDQIDLAALPVVLEMARLR